MGANTCIRAGRPVRKVEIKNSTDDVVLTPRARAFPRSPQSTPDLFLPRGASNTGKRAGDSGRASFPSSQKVANRRELSANTPSLLQHFASQVWKPTLIALILRCGRRCDSVMLGSSGFLLTCFTPPSNSRRLRICTAQLLQRFSSCNWADHARP